VNKVVCVCDLAARCAPAPAQVGSFQSSLIHTKHQVYTYITLFANLVVQNREKTNTKRQLTITSLKGKEHKKTMSRHSEYSTLSRITHYVHLLGIRNFQIG